MCHRLDMFLIYRNSSSLGSLSPCCCSTHNRSSPETPGRYTCFSYSQQSPCFVSGSQMVGWAGLPAGGVRSGPGIGGMSRWHQYTWKHGQVTPFIYTESNLLFYVRAGNWISDYIIRWGFSTMGRIMTGDYYLASNTWVTWLEQE